MICSYQLLIILYAILMPIPMKRGPIILIATLILISIFIIGMKYGRRVEQANKTISTILSITPPPTVIPTKSTPLTFTEYNHEGCGLRFTKPTHFKASKESTLGATLVYKDQIIAFECPQKQVRELELSDKTTATTSVLLNNKKLQGYTNGQNVRFVTDHPLKKTPIILSVDNN